MSAQVGANRDKSLLRRDKSGISRREVGAKSWLFGATSGLSRRGDKSGRFQRRPPRLLQNFKSGASRRAKSAESDWGFNVTFSDISATCWRDRCQVSKFSPAAGHPHHGQLGVLYVSSLPRHMLGTTEDVLNILVIGRSLRAAGNQTIHSQARPLYVTAAGRPIVCLRAWTYKDPRF